MLGSYIGLLGYIIFITITKKNLVNTLVTRENVTKYNLDIEKNINLLLSLFLISFDILYIKNMMFLICSDAFDA